MGMSRLYRVVPALGAWAIRCTRCAAIIRKVDADMHTRWHMLEDSRHG